MNQALGNVGATVNLHRAGGSAADRTKSNHCASWRAIWRPMPSKLLIIIGGNPVYSAPADFEFASLLVKSNFTVQLSPYDDETSALCHWHVPEAHYLESWSDVRAFDGTATIIQPLIAPLYGGRTAHELLSVLLGEPERTSYEIVRDYWRQQSKVATDFERFWRKSLHDGVVAGTAAPTKQVAHQANRACVEVQRQISRTERK